MNQYLLNNLHIIPISTVLIPTVGIVVLYMVPERFLRSFALTFSALPSVLTFGLAIILYPIFTQRPRLHVSFEYYWDIIFGLSGMIGAFYLVLVSLLIPFIVLVNWEFLKESKTFSFRYFFMALLTLDSFIILVTYLLDSPILFFIIFDSLIMPFSLLPMHKLLFYNTNNNLAIRHYFWGYVFFKSILLGFCLFFLVMHWGETLTTFL